MTCNQVKFDYKISCRIQLNFSLRDTCSHKIVLKDSQEKSLFAKVYRSFKKNPLESCIWHKKKRTVF